MLGICIWLGAKSLDKEEVRTCLTVIPFKVVENTSASIPFNGIARSRLYLKISSIEILDSREVDSSAKTTAARPCTTTPSDVFAEILHRPSSIFPQGRRPSIAIAADAVQRQHLNNTHSEALPDTTRNLPFRMSWSNGALTSSRPRGAAINPALSGGSPATFSIIKLLAVAILHPTVSYAAPLLARAVEEDEGKSPDDPDLWVYLGTAIALVLLGGAFAGLTIALMGQDEIYLQVIATSGDGSEKKHAKKVLNLLNRGKHWVLVTLLLSNVITNETLPIVLDRSLGGGWPAVVSSTVLIGMFEIQRKLGMELSTLTLHSYFRRNCATVSVCALWLDNWRMDGSICTRPHVDHGTRCMADRKIA